MAMQKDDCSTLFSWWRLLTAACLSATSAMPVTQQTNRNVMIPSLKTLIFHTCSSRDAKLSPPHQHKKQIARKKLRKNNTKENKNTKKPTKRTKIERCPRSKKGVDGRVTGADFDYDRQDVPEPASRSKRHVFRMKSPCAPCLSRRQ